MTVPADALAWTGATHATPLGRDHVHRVRRRDGTTAILKRVAVEDAAGEAAAGHALHRHGAPVPALLDADVQRGLLLLEDLGDGPSLASVLLGRTAIDPISAVEAWAGALADVHRAGRAVVREGWSRAPGPAAGWFTHWLDGDAPADLVAAVARLAPGFEPPSVGDRAWAWIQAVLRDPASPFVALTPGDVCPDNNVFADDGAVGLIDLTQAGVRHALLEVAYLLVPMPTCWCVRRFPPAVAMAGVAAYRAREPFGPDAGGDAFDEALAAATAGWCLGATAASLGRDDVDATPTWDEWSFTYASRRSIAVLRLRTLADLARTHPRLEPLVPLAQAAIDALGPVDDVPTYAAFA